MDLQQFYLDAKNEKHDLIVGGGVSQDVAEDAFQWLNYFRLFRPDMKILDFGCGFGRIAALMLQHMSADGFYYGVDILPQLVEFAKRQLEPAYPNSRFYLLKGRNDHYDRHLELAEANDDVILNIKNIAGNLDLIVNFSVFTHLDKFDANKYLSDFFGMLSPGGKLFITTFFVNEESLKNIHRGYSQIYFCHENVDPQGYYFGDPRDRLSAVAYQENDFIGMAVKHGFSVEQIHYGSWCGRQNRLSFQDIIILRKPESNGLPPGFDPERYLQKNPDVRANGANPVYHYLQHGIHEGREY